ncbi:MAG TPA: S8 family peptidase [Bacillota bacterium]|nr:S8 family peptidase [Bacillota bacterium]
MLGFERPVAANLMGVLGPQLEVVHSFRLMPVMAVRPPRGWTASAALAMPGLSFVEQNGQVLALETVPWGVERVGAPAAQRQFTGAGINVAILDTGIDSQHEDLRVLGGASFVGGDHEDRNGHGTHVAGTIAGLGTRRGVVGVAPGVRLYAVKVLDDDGVGTWLSVARGIEWAVRNNMRVVNLSLGSPQASRTLELACREAEEAGSLLVGAAGNSGGPTGAESSVNYPAAFGQVIAVAASDQRNHRAPWSSTGPEVELIAPGAAILSTAPGNRYTELSGTSMACPHVSGAAALAWSATPGLSALQVRCLLADTAEDLGMNHGLQGRGLVRADRAVEEAGKQSPNRRPQVSGLHPV